MYKYLFWGLTLSLLAFSGCKPAGALGGNDDKLKKIVLDKSSCKGKCPVFKLTVDEKGQAVYVGERYVKIIGEAKATWPDSTTQVLFAKIEEMKFVDLEEEYMTRFTDFQTISITYGKKTIKGHERKLPKEFLDLVKELDALIKETDWEITTVR